MAKDISVEISQMILSLSSFTFIKDWLKYSQWCISSIRSGVAYKKSIILF